MDCYTDWPDIIYMGNNTTAPQLINTLLRTFCHTGAPDVVWSDQGPQFKSKSFNDFSKEWGFQHITSSPRYPQSNGKAEATVKSMKKIIRAAWKRDSLDERTLTQALLQYRNTPPQRDRISPAQKLFGHPIQDTLPAHRRAVAPRWQTSEEEAEQCTITNAEQVEHYYNQHARALPEIGVGSKVAIQNTITKLWDIYGVVTAIGPYRRYFVKTAGGRVLVRNRRYLRRRVPPVLPPDTAGPLQAVDPDPNHPSPQSLRRSARRHTRPNRLIEEIAFIQV